MTGRISDSLATALATLGYADSDGLVTGDDSTALASGPLTSRNYLWRDLDRVGLDAAFFYDGVPLVGFSDSPTDSALHDLRKRLWNYGRVPILIAATDHGLAAYNGTSLPVPTGIGQLTDVFDQHQATAQDLADAFSRQQVETGRFSAQFKEVYRPASRVDQGLLRNLRYLRRIFSGQLDESRAALDALVGACITVSYLADRGALDEEHFRNLAGVPNLAEALRRGRSRTRALFSGLAEHFNGDVFGNVVPAISQVDDGACAAVAALLRGDDLPSGQGALWPYDFSVLPSDLVSNVYEQLLEDRQRQDAAYYTPRPIVDLILDEVIPWGSDNMPTLIDLACGSGAFLTEAFRRIAFKARWRKGSQLTYPELRELLTEHIFGVDMNPDAAKIAAFGAYLALLEEVKPPSIWSEVTLPTLVGTNIVVSDAFGDHPLQGRTFDAVVSNPPWKQELSPDAARFIRTRGVPIARNQIAQAFVWLAEEYLRPGGALGLVLPAKSVLHNRADQAQRFRAALFDRLDIRAIIDLSPIRRALFEKAISPPAVLVASKPPTLGKPDGRLLHNAGIIHITVRPRPSAADFGALLIVPEDLTVVSVSQARHRADIWKTLVWGTQRDLDFLDRVRAKQPILREVLNERGWDEGQGYKEAAEQEQKDASFLIGMPVIDRDSILPLRQPTFLPDRFSRTTLHRPRTAPQYWAPQVVIRRTLPRGRLAATFLSENAAYTSELLSISGPAADADFLRLVAAVVSSSFGNYWQFMTSASWGVERDSVEMNELLAMPLPCATLEEVDPAALDRALALAAPRTEDDPELLTELDDAIYDLFKFSPAERRRISSGISNGIARFQGGRDYRFLADDSDMESYTETVRSVLSRGIANVRVRTGYVRENNYVAVWASFSDLRDQSVLAPREIISVNTEEILRAGGGLAIGTTGMVALPGAFLIDDDAVYLVKTADRDRWSYDSALSDAERIFTALAFGA